MTNIPLYDDNGCELKFDILLAELNSKIKYIDEDIKEESNQNNEYLKEMEEIKKLIENKLKCDYNLSCISNKVYYEGNNERKLCKDSNSSDCRYELLKDNDKK